MFTHFITCNIPVILELYISYANLIILLELENDLEEVETSFVFSINFYYKIKFKSLCKFESNLWN